MRASNTKTHENLSWVSSYSVDLSRSSNHRRWLRAVRCLPTSRSELSFLFWCQARFEDFFQLAHQFLKRFRLNAIALELGHDSDPMALFILLYRQTELFCHLNLPSVQANRSFSLPCEEATFLAALHQPIIPILGTKIKPLEARVFEAERSRKINPKIQAPNLNELGGK